MRFAFFACRVKVALAVALAICTAGCSGQATALPPEPIAAVAQAQSVQAVTIADTAVTAGLVSNPAHPSARFAIVDTPAHGSVTVSSATFTYTPAAGYVGADVFHYVTVDAARTSTPATVNVSVLSRSVAPPSLATACTDLGPAFTPVCRAIADVTTPLVQACNAVTAGSGCSLLGGNKYGLVDGCFDVITGQLALTCHAVGTAMQLVASQCRVVNLASDYCALYSGSAIGTPAIRAYLAGPVHSALHQQYLLGLTLPLRDALVPSTHNSFNYTTANTPPTLSGMDPDQLYSLTQQLDLDMRGLELDIHWFPHLGAPGGYAPILCHGLANHLGCTFERTAASGLQEIRGWLDAHPDVVIVLYIEQHLDKPGDDVAQSFPAATAVIENALGRGSARDLLFRPDQVRAGATCATQGIPLDVSLAQIRAAGKQVLLYAGGCGRYPGWDAMTFNETNVVEKGEPVAVQYLDCHFTRAQYQTSWTRFFDSSTLIDALSGGTNQPMSPEQINEMVRCGVNAPSINFLDPRSGQPEGFVWSWAYGQPLSLPTQRCAVHNGAGRFQAESCGQYLPYVCSVADSWQIATARGEFIDGPTACAAQFPGGRFAVPRNGYQNELVSAAKAQAGVERAWLDYIGSGNDNWASLSAPGAAPTPDLPGLTRR